MKHTVIGVFNTTALTNARLMFKKCCLFYLLFFSLFFACLSTPLQAAEKVVLQLKWEHEFQFAGYYAALWKGYYQDEGLEVEIRSAATEDGNFLSPLEELSSGRADFAIGGMDVFVHRGKGRDITVLAPIFQRSPGELFALKNHSLQSIDQTAELRIAAIPSDDTYLEVRAMFFMNGVDPDRIHFVDGPVNLDSLINGRADAIVTYGISARIRAGELGIELNSLSPSDYGIQFYGDTLYTSGKLARERPEIAEKFLRASLKGWRYALEHRDEMAKAISAKLPRYVYHYDDFEAYNKAFSELIDEYTFYPALNLGHIDHQRWQRTYDILERLGEIDQPYNPASLLFTPPKVEHYHFSLLIWLVAAIVILLGLLAWKKGGRGGRIGSILALILLLEQGLEAWHRQDIKVQHSLLILERLATIRSKLEQVLSRNLSELNGVAAYIAANPELSQKEFENYASTILKLDPQLINLTAAPNLIATYVYPRAGNEALIGMDYRDKPEQLPAIRHAIDSRGPIIAGPVDLVQGGRAFIGRTPVRVISASGNVRNWGIVSAPIDVAAVYREAGLFDPELELKIAIRGKDGAGAGGEVFYGHPELFEHPEVATQTVSIGGGAWQIGAVATDTEDNITPRLLLIRISALLVALLSVLLYLVYRRNRESQKQYQTVLRRQAKFLHEVENVARVGGWRMGESEKISELSEQAYNLLAINTATTELTVDAFSAYFLRQEGLDIAQRLREALHNREAIDLELLSANGLKWLRLIADPLADDDGSCELLGAIQDITDKKIADEKIERQANYDNLTNLPNRALFRDRLETAILRAARTGKPVVLLFVDLDNFKSINDNYGHFAGDQVLQEAAHRIQNCVRKSDTVGRHSGDEFTIILQDVESETIADRISAQLVTSLSKAFDIDGTEAHCGASIGIACFPADADNAESLIINADQAMYEVKKSGRNGWHFYTREMQHKSEYRHHLYNDLINAIHDDQLIVYLQPIVDTHNGRIVACEALARWQRNDGTWISPGEFIPFAEETGLINQLDYLVMKKAVNTLEKINRELDESIRLSVNVSPRLFLTKDNALSHWMELVRSACQRVPITVEITERLLTEESHRATNALRELAAMDIHISIDDFGTGYSSLSYLTRFPVTGLKIDRSFVAGIGENATMEQLIETILVMANKLKLDVVAEGVETVAQLNYLKALGCRHVQGYFLGKPMSVDSFREQLQLEIGIG